ncbi:MAG: hypothetical protein M3R00_05040 [Pseudomonadota bacterium]|nr:hypothetical protein [Pseudomonadota bacterium]
MKLTVYYGLQYIPKQNGKSLRMTGADLAVWLDTVECAALTEPAETNATNMALAIAIFKPL